MSRHVALACALALVTTAACGVKKETHQKVLDELTATQAELDETRRQRDQLKSENAELSDRLGITQSEKGEAAERAAKLAKEMKATEAELMELRKQRAAAEKRLQAFRDLKKRFAKLVDTGKLKVTFRKGQMVLELPSGILFPSGQAKLTKAGENALAEVLNILLEFKDRRFMIAGHTDTDPIKSRKFKSNWDLSTARALSVVQFMIKAGFPAANVGAAGYGEFDPVAPNDSEQNKQLNRRIEIILVPDLSELPSLTETEPS
ncbi:MAG TPA: OmpA family protein [Kofleriaceae bacterium]|nr:OmpA family protein [Kofleriaceae bacterium]